MTTVLGIDASLSATGLCWDRSATAALRPPTVERDERLLWFYKAFRNLVEQHLPDLVVIESPFVAGPSRGDSTVKLGELYGVLRLALRGRRVAWVSPAAIKKLATGKGNATKPDMRLALFKRTALDVNDDNRVDAWWLWCAGMLHFGLEPIVLPQVHLDGLVKVEWP